MRPAEQRQQRMPPIRKDIPMTKFISELAAGLVPYVPGEQPKGRKFIKLNTNENPYPPSEQVLRAVREEASSLRLYPDPQADAVRDAAAAYYNEAFGLTGGEALNRDNIFAGNGSDEVLSLLCPAFFTGKKIAFADITYSFYPSFLSLFAVPYEQIPLAEDFSVRIEDYLALDDTVGGIILCNPNAPTGRGLPLADIERILEGSRNRLVVVDEAYVDFGGESCIPLTKEYDNLLVVQTFSKSRSLAGARLGYAIGDARLIADLDAVRCSMNPYNVNSMSLAAGAAALEDDAYYRDNCRRIEKTRQETEKRLREMGFAVLPSRANFLFAAPPDGDGGAYYRRLKQRGVLVRHFKLPRIAPYVRISIGTPEQMDVLLRRTEKILKEGQP